MAVSFVKRGLEAHKALQKAEKEAEARQAARGKFRFWMKEGEERLVTFLDGDLTEDGLLDTASFNQHQVKMNGQFRNYFVCTEDQEPCPLCEMGNYKTLVSCFTVIDHTKYTDRNGKVHRHERKLFVAKRDTMKRLQKAATKHGGLRGWTVTIGRIGDKSPEVGTDFDFMEEQDLPALAKQLKLPPEGIKPFDYEKDIRYLTADELRDMGFGSAVVGKAEAAAVLGKKSKVVTDDDDDDDDDMAFVKKGAAKAKPAPAKAKKSLFASDDDDDDASIDAPLDDDDDDDQDL